MYEPPKDHNLTTKTTQDTYEIFERIGEVGYRLW